MSSAAITSMRGYSLTRLMGTTNNIPSCSGVYIWRYWPAYEDSNFNSLLDFCNKIRSEFPLLEENLSNSRVDVKIKKSFFGEIDTDLWSSFGLSASKVSKMESMIDGGLINLSAFQSFFDVLMLTLPPLYIGKADNIQTRLKVHFDRKSDVLPRIDSVGIKQKDVYISFIKDVAESSEGANSIIENILQHISRPPLTKRYG